MPWLGRAVSIEPRWFVAQTNRGNAEAALGRFGSARRAHRRALALAPGVAPVWANAARAEQALLELRRTELFLLRALAVVEHPQIWSNLIFALSYRADIDERRLFRTVRRSARRFDDRPKAPPVAEPDVERRLRVGYLSSDLRSHPVGWNLIGLLENHDPRLIECFGYAAIRSADQLSRRFEAACSGGWRMVGSLGDDAIADIVRADRIDILVVAAGHTEGNRLGVAALRPAPIQASIHDLTSSGMPAIDYWFTDDLLHPETSAEQFTETLVRLPCFYQHMPPPKVDVAEADKDRDTVRFGSVNNPAKFNDGLFGLWARILAEVPSSRLCLRYFGHFAGEEGRAPVLERLRRLGISPERIQFSVGTRDRVSQLAHLGSLDIALDPFPFNGATSTFEALWMGLPVVTLAGNRFLGRVGASHLARIGLSDLVAETPEDYVRLAVALAADEPRRRGLKATIRERLEASPLCDGAAYARSVEMAYREMWRARVNGRPWTGGRDPGPAQRGEGRS